MFFTGENCDLDKYNLFITLHNCDRMLMPWSVVNSQDFSLAISWSIITITKYYAHLINRLAVFSLYACVHM